MFTIGAECSTGGEQAMVGYSLQTSCIGTNGFSDTKNGVQLLCALSRHAEPGPANEGTN